MVFGKFFYLIKNFGSLKRIYKNHKQYYEESDEDLDAEEKRIRDQILRQDRTQR